MTPAEASQLRFMDPERVAAQAQAFAEALGRLGEPITEAQGREIAARHQCECQEGMFALAPTRRGLLGSAGLIGRRRASPEPARKVGFRTVREAG